MYVIWKIIFQFIFHLLVYILFIRVKNYFKQVTIIPSRSYFILTNVVIKR